MAKKRLEGDLFDVVQDARTAAGVRERGAQARVWFQKNIKKMFARHTIDDRRDVIGDYTQPKAGKKWTGKMYMFFYNPKHRATLPYYDKFPLIFIVSIYDDGFLGLNMHYLPPKIRLKLFDSLLTITGNKSLSTETRIRMNYKVLSSMRKFRWAAPAYKRYLTKHIRSRIRQVSSRDWEMALFLPTERFAKASKQKVWNDSRKKIR